MKVLEFSSSRSDPTTPLLELDFTATHSSRRSFFQIGLVCLKLFFNFKGVKFNSSTFFNSKLFVTENIVDQDHGTELLHLKYLRLIGSFVFIQLSSLVGASQSASFNDKDQCTLCSN